jgi:hypothetical protein
MKILPLIFSMAVSAVGGTFAVTSWAVEGSVQNVGTSVLRTNRDHISEDAGRTDSDRVASDGADRLGGNRVVSDGAERVGASKLADLDYRNSPEVRVADTGYSGINQTASTYFCGPCR